MVNDYQEKIKKGVLEAFPKSYQVAFNENRSLVQEIDENNWEDLISEAQDNEEVKEQVQNNCNFELSSISSDNKDTLKEYSDKESVPRESENEIIYSENSINSLEAEHEICWTGKFITPQETKCDSIGFTKVDRYSFWKKMNDRKHSIMSLLKVGPSTKYIPSFLKAYGNIRNSKIHQMVCYHIWKIKCRKFWNLNEHLEANTREHVEDQSSIRNHEEDFQINNSELIKNPLAISNGRFNTNTSNLEPEYSHRTFNKEESPFNKTQGDALYQQKDRGNFGEPQRLREGVGFNQTQNLEGQNSTNKNHKIVNSYNGFKAPVFWRTLGCNCWIKISSNSINLSSDDNQVAPPRREYEDDNSEEANCSYNVPVFEPITLNIFPSIPDPYDRRRRVLTSYYAPSSCRMNRRNSRHSNRCRYRNNHHRYYK